MPVSLAHVSPLFPFSDYIDVPGNPGSFDALKNKEEVIIEHRSQFMVRAGLNNRAQSDLEEHFHITYPGIFLQFLETCCLPSA